MARCYALPVMLSIFVVFPIQNITNVDIESTSSCVGMQFKEQSRPSPPFELDIYQFDALRLAWTVGRLGLHRHFIVAFTNNGMLPIEEPSSVNLGVTFEFLTLPFLCVRPRLEMADPQGIEAMRIVVIKWKRYLTLRVDTFNPHTKNNCLFMSVAFVLRQRGIFMSQQELRNRTAKLWSAGAECFSGSLAHWAAVSQMTNDCYITRLRTNGWGSAADACILANSLQASCYIYNANGALIVASPCSPAAPESTTPWWMTRTLRLLNEICNLAIGIKRSPLLLVFLEKVAPSSFFLEEQGYRVPRSSLCRSLCSTSSIEAHWMDFQLFLAGGWLKRSSLCASTSFLHQGGAGSGSSDALSGTDQTKVSHVLRFDAPRALQQFSGVRYHAEYISAGSANTELLPNQPPLPLVITSVGSTVLIPTTTTVFKNTLPSKVTRQAAT
eukprot:3763348-Amphidinium_carterae.2